MRWEIIIISQTIFKLEYGQYFIFSIIEQIIIIDQQT